jgi:amidase
MSDLVFLTASQLAQVIRERRASAVEVLDAHLKQIEQHNPPLNAIVTLDAEHARQRAREADEALAHGGDVWGPLHGVPITIKDSFETAGLRTTSGYPPWADYVPQQDAPVVAALKRAGAIVLGKTNLPPLADGGQSVNPIFGRTSNPWNLDCTPGGSSGGGAAAVAAGLSPLDMGSDISGSIRMPAHFCGIYSLKPTGGRIPIRGHRSSVRPLVIPSGWEALLLMPCAGPLARSIDDLYLCLSVTTDPGTPALSPVPDRSMRPLRIAWSDEMGSLPIDTDTRTSIQTLAATLAESGCVVERRTAPNLNYDDAWQSSAEALAAVNTLFQPPFTQFTRRLLGLVPSAALPRQPVMRGLARGAAQRSARMAMLFKQRDALIQRVETFLQAWDVWIAPAFSRPAFTHRPLRAPIEIEGRSFSLDLAEVMANVIFNFTGHPVVVIPIGFSRDGLPIGVQIVGRRWGELALLDAARQIDQAIGRYCRPPGY